MNFLIGLLTAAMVVNCLILILLVLIQLPKKEAGVGVAFGSSTTDALFGAGTGNVLTKATKWATIFFFVFLISVGYLQSHKFHGGGKAFESNVEKKSKELPLAPKPVVPATPVTPAVIPSVPTNSLLEIPTATTNK